MTVDAEDHTTTDSTLSIVRELRADFPWLGTVLQAYLKRTEADCEEFAASGARIRLCKGAYDEPASVAYRERDDVTDSYLRCLRVLMAGYGLPDGRLARSRRSSTAVPAMARESGRGVDDFEYQMLYGIRDAEQRTAGRRRQPRAGVRTVRHRVVRLLRAPAGRAARQPDVLPAGAGRTQAEGDTGCLKASTTRDCAFR